MAHSKQAIKRIRTSEERRLRNKQARSGVKNAIKKARRSGAAESVVAAEKTIDKAARKGVIHKNAAARKKSRLARALNKARAAAAS